MHLYFITRGNRRFTREFLDRCEDNYFGYKYKKQNAVIQFSPKEVKLWEASIPRDKLHDAMTLLGHSDYKENKFLNKIKKYAAKLLRLDPLPNQKEINSKKKQIFRHGVGVHLIGTKEDKDSTFGEML